MFTQFRNIDSAFKHIKTFSIFLIIAAVSIACFSIFYNVRVIEKASNRIYILYNGKVLEAVASDKKSNIPVELRDHIKTFHQLFFNLNPDDKAIRATVGRALYLSDESAKKQYDNLRESGYYNNLISANIAKEVQLDSIKLNIEQYPYQFTYYGTEKLVRSSSTVFRRLVTQGYVYDLKEQTDENPHGFIIRNWEILENQDLPPKS
ncbi:conjugative transposon protein TraK [Pedobacter cryoconitis]|uniref:Conjugative transposon TraK protein n=1 Tax=Pedobacter cryoconitis TaxID=188932 RepID=A0A327SI11_9SPHI|nr:conjugative transposon protein TraK [Pedobacter cryoconitis]RAJ28092.1 conjugative transposon TraK protein [Pedobacter cryoconitis]